VVVGACDAFLFQSELPSRNKTNPTSAVTTDISAAVRTWVNTDRAPSRKKTKANPTRPMKIQNMTSTPVAAMAQ
jgi:hypothetical protein